MLQTVQYMQPQHHEKLAQAELLVIDEAAAIPLPVVKSLLGPYLVFLCSTVNGYEGTGRSLSLKLIHQLRSEGAKLASSKNEGSEGRSFREVQLQEPIRCDLALMSCLPHPTYEEWQLGLQKLVGLLTHGNLLCTGTPVGMLWRPGCTSCCA